jgi:predicted nuclease with TOPRIM domain
MPDLQNRRLLYDRLEEVLGAEPARILMQQLPPTGEVATRSDMRDLGDRMDRLEDRMDRLEDRMDRLESHMDRFDDRLHDFHGALREQTRIFVLASIGTMVTLAGIAFAAGAII